MKDTKTHQRRRVTLPPALLADLVAHLETVPADAGALLRPSRTGRPLRYASYRLWVWDPAAVKAGLAQPKPIPVRRPADRLGKPGPKPKPKTHDLWTVTVTPHSLLATRASVVTAEGRDPGGCATAGPLEPVRDVHALRPSPRGRDLKAAGWLDRLRPPTEEANHQ